VIVRATLTTLWCNYFEASSATSWAAEFSSLLREGEAYLLANGERGTYSGLPNKFRTCGTVFLSVTSERSKRVYVYILRLGESGCVCVLLLQDLLQSCSRGGRRRVEDMCYERRRAEACVDESAHHALVNAGSRADETPARAREEGKEGGRVRRGGAGADLCRRQRAAVAGRSSTPRATHWCPK
jgi:hypothetical protein